MSLLKASLTVSGWTGISRVFGLVRDIVIANKLGTSAASDAFFMALLLPNLLRRLFTEGAFNMAFVPLLTRIDEKDQTDSERFASAALTWLGLALIVVLILAEIFMHQVVALIAFDPELYPEKFALTVLYGRITFPYLVGITIASLIGGICTARRRFAAFAIMPMLLNVSFLACLFTLPAFGIEPAMAASIAVPLGGILQAGFMVWALRKLKFNLRLVWPPKHPRLGSLLARLGPAALSVGVLQLSFLIDNKMASNMAQFVPSPEIIAKFGDNAVSYLNYANKFYQFPLALIGIAMATVLLPHFASALERKDKKGAKDAFDKSFVAGLALAASATAGLMILAEPMLTTFFGHGKFTGESVRFSAWAMMAYAAGLPGYITTKITMSAFYANEDTKTPVKAALVALAINIAANFILIRSYGHVGIAAGTAIAGWSNAAIQLWFVQRQGFVDLNLKALSWPILKALALGLAIFGCLVVYQAFVPFVAFKLLQLLWIIGAIAIGVGVFAAGAQYGGLFNVRQALRALTRRAAAS